MPSRLRSMLLAARPLLGLAGGLALVGLSGYAFTVVASAVFSAKTGTDPRNFNAVFSYYFLVTTVILGVYAGLDQTTNRRIAHSHAQGTPLRPAILRAVRDAVGLTSAVAVGLLALGFVLLPRTLHGDVALYVSLFVGICTAAAASVVRGVLAGSHRFVAYGGVWAAEGLSRIAMVAAILVGGAHSTWTFGVAYVVPFLISALAGLVLCRPTLRASAEAARRAALAGTAPADAGASAATGAMGLWSLALAGLLTTAVGNLPQLVFGSRVESSDLAAAAFGSAFLIARIALTALTPFQSMLLPTFTRMAVARQLSSLRRHLLRAVVICSGFGAVWTVLVVVAGPFLVRTVFHAAPENVPGLGVFLALGGGTILFAAASAVQPALVALGRYRHVPFIWAAGVAATLAGAFWPGLTPIDAATLSSLTGPAGVLLAMAVSAWTGAFRGDDATPEEVAAAEDAVEMDAVAEATAEVTTAATHEG